MFWYFLCYHPLLKNYRKFLDIAFHISINFSIVTTFIVIFGNLALAAYFKRNAKKLSYNRQRFYKGFVMSYMSIKQMIVGFIVCGFVACTDNPKECKNEQDKIQGCVAKTYYTNGNLWQEIPYKNGEIDGIKKWYRINGNLSSETPYKDGKEDGIAKEYYENGNLKHETPYKDGKEDGIEKWYRINGDLSSETPYTNGKTDGIVKWYYDNGNLWRETPYKNGEIDGIDKWCYENGNLWKEIPFKNIEIQGEVRLYLDNKQPLATITYKDSKAIKGKCANNKILDNNTLESINNTITIILLDEITKVLKEYCK